MEAETKICRVCGNPRPITNFTVRPKSEWINGEKKRGTRCRLCIRIGRKARDRCVCGRALDTGVGYYCSACVERKKKNDAAFRKRLKVAAINAYGGACAYCGEDRLVFLSIDHKFNDGAEHRKATGDGKILQWLRKNSYPKDIGLQVACYNCNMAKAIVGEEELLRIRTQDLTNPLSPATRSCDSDSTNRSETMVYVDIPQAEMIGDENGSWLNVAEFETKAEAVAWIRENIGSCDDDGNINLLSNVESDGDYEEVGFSPNRQVDSDTGCPVDSLDPNQV